MKKCLDDDNCSYPSYLGPDKEDQPKGQDHILEVSQSDRITIKCGGASIVVYPTGRIMRCDEETGMRYWDLILGQEPEL